MANGYRGISEELMRESQLNLLKFANIHDDENLRFTNVDINI